MKIIWNDNMKTKIQMSIVLVLVVFSLLASASNVAATGNMDGANWTGIDRILTNAGYSFLNNNSLIAGENTTLTMNANGSITISSTGGTTNTNASLLVSGTLNDTRLSKNVRKTLASGKTLITIIGGTGTVVAWNGQYWLIGGTGPKLWKYDGENLTDLSSNLVGFDTNYPRDIAWSPQRQEWLIGGYNGAVNKYDGTTFTDLKTTIQFNITAGPSYGEIRNIDWNGEYYMLSGGYTSGSEAIAIKWDGTTRTSESDHFSSTTFVYGQGWNGRTWLFGGTTTAQMYEWTGTSAWYVFDSGISPTGTPYSIEWNGEYWMIAGGSSKFLAKYEGSATPEIGWSKWTDLSNKLPGSGDFPKVAAYANGIWLVHTTNGLVVYDGVYNITMPALTLTSNYGNAMKSNGQYILAIDGTNVIAFPIPFSGIESHSNAKIENLNATNLVMGTTSINRLPNSVIIGGGAISFSNGTNNILIGTKKKKRMATAGTITALYISQTNDDSCSGNITVSSSGIDKAFIAWSNVANVSSTGLTATFNQGEWLMYNMTENTGCKDFTFEQVHTKSG